MAAHSEALKLLREGLAKHQAGRLAEAAAVYARVRLLDATLFDAWHLGGMAALQAGDLAAAETLLSGALLRRPEAIDTLIPYATVLVAKGAPERAEPVLRRAVGLAPSHFLAWDKLGLALRAQGRHAEAVSCHEKALTLSPASPVVLSSLGTTLEQAGRLLEALDAYRRAVEAAPEDRVALEGYANCLYKAGRLHEALPVHDRLLALAPQAWASHSRRLMALCSDERIGARELSEAHAGFGRRVRDCVVEQRIPRRGSGGPLRVGFLSSELWNHPVGRFLLPFLEHADPAREQVFLYLDSPRKDEVVIALTAAAQATREVHGLTDSALRERVLADRLDVLVELTGHGLGNRLPLVASRLAPVQVSYLGYPCTTGFPSIDYRLVDAITDPEPGADALSTERLLRFAPTAWCYRPPAEAPAPQRKPGPITFGCFNQVGKMGDGLLRQWGLLLESLPESRLLLKGYGLTVASYAQPLLQRLAAAGIPDSRVELRGLTPGLAEHLACYQEVDVALDTFPYGGTTTTCEALWMGVPVVTLRGDRHASRVGASLLSSIACDEWIASDWDTYRRLVLSLAARNGSQLRGEALRERLRASPLMDEVAQSSRFWSALHTASHSG
jgi:predicted O-linked N-acetylglucosamine transferase (SPINDLY family)